MQVESNEFEPGPVEGSVRRTRLTSEARRQQIAEAARRLFLSLGPSGASMQKIAKDVGVNSALLYQHFDSVADLFEKVILEPMQEAVQRAIAEGDELIASEVDARNALLQLHVSLLTIMVEVAPTVGMIIFADRFSARQYLIDRVSLPIRLWVEKILTERQVLPSPSGEGSDIQVTSLLGIHMLVALDASYRRVDLDIEQVATQIHKLYCVGAFEKR